MKKVLIADRHTLFRDFLKDKLEADQIEVVISFATRDLYAKMITSLPNLIILDMEKDNEEELEFLVKKSQDFNTAGIPVIVTGEKQDRKNIAALAKYGVIKYFEKPIQFDMFFSSIGLSIHAPLSLDTTPCVLDLHRNKSIIFVELALGLNREKISLLKFKLAEMIEKEKIDNPKVILMLTNLDLTFVDGYNLEFLIDNILDCEKLQPRSIKVLSFSPYVRDFLDGHENYKEIEISTNLPNLLNSLIDTSTATNVSDLITNQILAPTNNDKKDDSITTRFSTEETAPAAASKKNSGTVLNVAIIDSNDSDLEISKNSFESVGASCACYSNGSAFMKEYDDKKFDLVILDVLLSDGTGFNILKYVNAKPLPPPVIVYSNSLQRDVIVKSLGSGAKSYLPKPQKPNVLVQKSLALLKIKNTKPDD